MTRFRRSAAAYFNWRMWSAGLMAVAAVFLVVKLTAPSRTADGGGESPGTQIALAAPAAAARPLRFHWTSGLVAPLFAFSITDGTGREVFRSRTSAATMALPADAASRLQPGQTYNWTVTALDPADKPIATATSTFIAAAPRR